MQIKRLIQLCLVLGLLTATDAVFAQAKRTKKTRSGGSNYSDYGSSSSSKNNYSNYGNASSNAADTTQRQKGAANNKNNYSNYGTPTAGASTTRDTSLPITVVPATSGGLMDSVRPSLRNDAPFEQNLVKDKAVLDYENLREDDAAYRVRYPRKNKPSVPLCCGGRQWQPAFHFYFITCY